MDFLEGLNPPQREAVCHTDGPLLILAGAGSGKTRVITHRMGHMIRVRGIYPSSILAVTFTNKAAQEMRSRIAKLLGEVDSQRLPQVSTFHSFCVRLLRRSGANLAQIRPGFTTQFNIYDADDQLALMKQIFRSLALDEKFMKYNAALSVVSNAKSARQTPQDFHKLPDPKMQRLAVIYERYELALRQANALDFDDLLLEAVRLLRHDTEMRAQYNRALQYLMIDEYQDTNRCQYDLMRLLSDAHKNVCVVGDEDQSIYGWRGADIKNILDFEKDFPNAKVIRLEQNYRSTKNILEAAGAVVANNKMRKGKTLWTDAEKGARIGLYEGMDGENEALFIADSIDKVLRESRDERVAVLYRTNFQSRQIEEALRRYNLKYVVVGGFSFYQRAEIKDMLSYLKCAHSPHDSISLLRVINTPARGIGKTTVEEIERFALQNGISVWSAIGRMLEEKHFPGRAENALSLFQKLLTECHEAAASQTVPDVLRLIIERSGYQRMLEADLSPDSPARVENISELLNAAAEAAERGETINEFLDHAALVSDSDGIDEQARINLLTMHNAKGLEFPSVFVAGMEDGLFPHSRSLESESQMEEERRLCYVAMTRAERRLTLSWARFRRKFGGGLNEPTIRSRFLREVPAGLIQPLGKQSAVPQVDLFAEQHEVRESVKRNLYTGKTYNSLENISQFFEQRGLPPPPKPVAAPVAQRPAPVAQPPKPKNKSVVGTTLNHSKYGRGTVLRQEGEGDDMKVTVSFPGYGLKKLIAKFAGLKVD
jgi:DNA helicase-2/ATP-dependent DNA helicase PcrA